MKKINNSKIAIICGLGNPGDEYKNTRHNLGFWLVEAIADHYQVNLLYEKKFKAYIGKLIIDHHPCWLLLPQTYMNLSGESVSKFMAYHKLTANQLLVIHDELDLPVGKIKFKFGGGEAGHQGLINISKLLHNKQYARLRLGIGHPGNKQQVSNYVLHPPNKTETQELNLLINKLAEKVPTMINHQWETIVNQLNPPNNKG